ncbi:MAG TPA: asparagine synthase (glutamine-hydrolyzing) [Spirochaetota bacterium]|nr:asparagine synthase (glutamine-hydrolyzing) [Spirochaetota bacterium]HPL17825.1 asparagine synthase (glutamine-hydrolyzing) [Spirochaetota bacterium]HRT77271.1 asparagine synthase (glutamine-hydrolyzing) [Spirochaetota bacterium]
MCGIAGYVDNAGVKKSVLQSMSDEIAHRGPDGAGEYISPDGTVGFSHRRLSIIDLSERGAQPMSNEDGSIWITYNGEIYNFPGIRKYLVDKKHIFKSNCDTEVIIHAYEEWGIECINRLNGIFAFAIYDMKRKIVFLGRDRFGVKPLYYGLFDNNIFIFASEIKAILKHPSFKKEINWQAVGDYFKYRYIPSPRSIWENIFKLEHGFYAYYSLTDKQLKKTRYYDLPRAVRNKKITSLDEVKTGFEQAVKSQMVSDVELGTFLSGGIDSSSVSAIAHTFNPKIKSFSIGFEPLEHSELRYSELVANYIGTKHITRVIDDLPEDIIEKNAYYYDEPLADSSCLPTFILSEMTAGYLKVVLSGDGGDEVFGGYNWYDTYLLDYRNYFNSCFSRVKSLFSKTRVLPDFEKYYNRLLLNRFNENVFKNLFMPDIFDKVFDKDENLYEKYASSDFKCIKSIQYIDMNTFMVDDILVKVDRASMAHSLEVRVPFLDHEFVESVLCLPEKIYPSDSTGKPVLKKLMKGSLPDEIFSRSKQGFSAPLNKWKGFSSISEEIANGFLIKDAVININFIEELKEQKYMNSDAIMWMIFIFEKWYQRWGR